VKIYNYTGSGKDSVEAIEDMRDRLSRKVPGRIADWLIKTFGQLALYCDGCGAHGRTNMEQDRYGLWGESGGWIHIRYSTPRTNGWVGLDFCPDCQSSGRMTEAIREGRQPLGKGSSMGPPIGETE
jgi:hypothetical protein